jgi:hypothetical protein
MCVPERIGSYRFQLRGQIHLRGFRTLTEFAEAVGSHVSVISKVVNGWEFPKPELENSIAERLGMSVESLREML